MGCNGQAFEELTLIKIARQKWAAIGRNGNSIEELPHGKNRHVRVGCDWLQWGDF